LIIFLELAEKRERTCILSPYLQTFKEPKNRFHGIKIPPGWESIPGLPERFTTSGSVLYNLGKQLDRSKQNQWERPCTMKTMAAEKK